MATPNPFNMEDEFLKDQGINPDKVIEVDSMAEVYERIEKMFGDTMENILKITISRSTHASRILRSKAG
jgi:hypothetical protein